jgi:hypothetical protein
MTLIDKIKDHKIGVSIIGIVGLFFLSISIFFQVKRSQAGYSAEIADKNLDATPFYATNVAKNLNIMLWVFFGMSVLFMGQFLVNSN